MSDVIEAFLALAHHGHMGSAANSIFLSQPAFSARIARLEREVGLPLFHRHRDGMTLTAAGEALLPHARESVQALEAGIRAAREVALGLEPVLRVAAGPVVNDYVMPDVLERLRAEHPMIRIQHRTLESSEIAAAVRAGEIDLGIVPARFAEQQRTIDIYDLEYQLVMAPDYPIAEMLGEPGEGVSQVTLIRIEGPGDFRLTKEMEAELRLSPHATVTVDRVESAKRMVRRGLGIALLSSTAVAGDRSAGDLVLVPIASNEPIRRRMVIIQRAGLEQSTSVALFCDHLRRIPWYIPGTRMLAA